MRPAPSICSGVKGVNFRQNPACRVRPMRAMLALAGCTKATASRIDDRTLRIEGPGLPSGSTAPNRCVAERVCPKGYRGLKELERRNTSDGPRSEEGIFTNRTIRSI